MSAVHPPPIPPVHPYASLITAVAGAIFTTFTIVSLIYRRLLGDHRVLLKEAYDRIDRLHTQIELQEKRYDAQEKRYDVIVDRLERRWDKREEDEIQLKQTIDDLIRKGAEREEKILTLNARIEKLERENAELRRIVNACPVTDQACPIRKDKRDAV